MSIGPGCKAKPYREHACDPCAAALINYEGGPNRSRFSWDPLTTLVAVRGAAAGSTYECHGCAGPKGCCDGRNVAAIMTTIMAERYNLICWYDD